MFRKLGLLTVALACVSAVFAPPAAATFDPPRTAIVRDIFTKGSHYIVATGQAVETKVSGGGLTTVSGSCEAAVQNVPLVYVSQADSTAAGTEGAQVVCYLYDVTEDIRYFYGAWHTDVPAHANWTSWTLPDHRLQLCLWAGFADDQWEMSYPMTCVDLT